MKIEPGKYFEIAYDLYRVNPDGTETLVHQVTDEDPDRAICGETIGFVEALDEELAGKEEGAEFDFVAEPDKAFGPYSEEEIYTIPREQMTVDGNFKEEMFTPGALIPLMTPDGYRIDGTVVRLTPEAVVLDLNHPLAKDKVHYKGRVVTVREPKPEELSAAQGGGCCGGGCGCHGGDCGDDCGCGDNHSDDCGCGGCGCK